MLHHISPTQIEDVNIQEGDIVLFESPSFYNLVELSDLILDKCAFPYFSVTHGTYSKIKLNKIQLTNSDGITIVSSFNSKFVSQFILNPSKLKLDDVFFISDVDSKITEISNHLESTGVHILSGSYLDLEKLILTNSEIDLLYFQTTKIHLGMKKNETYVLNYCIKKIRSGGYGIQYIERFQKEFDILKRYGMLEIFSEVEKQMKGLNGILRGSANNSLICFLFKRV